LAQNSKWQIVRVPPNLSREVILFVIPNIDDHGEFTKIAGKHIFGKEGCPKCSPRKSQRILEH